MDDKLLEMLVNARKKRKITSRALSEGVCAEDMYNKVERGERVLDRMSVKRLLARLGVDNGSYENYLEYADYMVWKRRMEIINAVEKDELIKAEKLLDGYLSCNVNGRNKSRDNIQQQFYIFLSLQIIRHRNNNEYENQAYKMYEEALKKTVPNIDKRPINEILLSPLEFIMTIEYKRRKKNYKSIEQLLLMYTDFFKYADGASYGKLSMAKVYPKLVVCLYQDLSNTFSLYTLDNSKIICEKLLVYCDRAYSIIKERKEMFYLVELLEIIIELRQHLKFYLNDFSRIKEYEEHIKNAESQLEIMKDLYKEYNIVAHMRDDCYLYRESGIYCIPNVIKARREMMYITQKMLCEDLCDIRTLSREENGQVAVQRYTFTEIFKRLNLYPDYINMGVVTEDKGVIELYEDIRYATNSFRYDDVDILIQKLKKRLKNNEHSINEQVLISIDNRNKWLTRRIGFDEYINTLHKALEKTIKLQDIVEEDKPIFLTIRELTLVYQISLAYKEQKQFDKAYNYIKKVWDYCKKWEEQALEDGRIGTYEMIMSYMSSLLGDLGRFEEANAIADKLIGLSLRLRRNFKIHQSIYDKAWNNNKCKKTDFNYKSELNRCASIARLIGDTNDELFYRETSKL